jgi:peptidylprolyl isomerase
MSVKNTDFILLDFSCSIKESGEVIETTSDEVAKAKNLYKEGATFEPLFVAVGEGWIPKGLDESLVGLEVGSAKTIEVAPEKAYGERDPSKVRLVPLRRFRGEGVAPVPGASIQIDGKAAIVRAVGAGRVQVDYNHPLAGKTLIYEVTVKKIIEDSTEKLKSITHRVIPSVDIEKFSLEMGDNQLKVQMPEEAFFLEGLQILKRSMATDILRFNANLDSVVFLEVVKKPQAAAEQESKVA